MILHHPYCRTCGSKVQNKNVCNHCGCEPLTGNNYCCDCGTSTMSQAIMCVECGASFQRKFPAVLAILIGGALAITVAGTGFFISQHNSATSEKVADTLNLDHAADTSKGKKIPVVKSGESFFTIINNISPKLLRRKDDAIVRVAKNTEKVLPRPPEEKPVAPAKIIVKPITPPVEKIEVPSGRMSMNVFSSREVRAYSAGCTYYEGRSKSNVVFFTTNVYGYIKINGKIYALQGVQKGNDVARFSGAGYEVTVEIEGLAGNESAWVAEGTITVKDSRQRTLSRNKVYSGFTDF